MTTDLQSAPVGHFGIFPFCIRTAFPFAGSGISPLASANIIQFFVSANSYFIFSRFFLFLLFFSIGKSLARVLSVCDGFVHFVCNERYMAQ